MNNYIIGIYLDELKHRNDYSCANIFDYSDGVLELIDSKKSRNSSDTIEFVKKYEPNYFTKEYNQNKAKELHIAKLKKLIDEGKITFTKQLHINELKNLK